MIYCTSRGALHSISGLSSAHQLYAEVIYHSKSGIGSTNPTLLSRMVFSGTTGCKVGVEMEYGTQYGLSLLSSARGSDTLDTTTATGSVVHDPARNTVPQMSIGSDDERQDKINESADTTGDATQSPNSPRYRDPSCCWRWVRKIWFLAVCLLQPLETRPASKIRTASNVCQCVRDLRFQVS